MLSRVAECLFWMGRYLERSENTARILEVNHTLLLDFHVPFEQQWMPILIISGHGEDFKEEPTAERVQEFLTWDEKNPFSIVSSIAWARENARTVRESISGEMWERMNFYHLWLKGDAAREVYEANRHEFYSQVKRINQLIHGICDATLTHGDAWEFFRLGTYLERACQTARILDVKYHTLLPKVSDVGTPEDNAHWIAILMSCSGYEPFNKIPRQFPFDPGVAVGEFLILDEFFPRSIRRCLGQCQKSIAAASRADEGYPPTTAALELDALVQWLTGKSILELIGNGLHESLTHVVDTIHRIGDAVRTSFFDVEFVPPVKPGLPSQSQTQGSFSVQNQN
jgi:uncharacterized alpha-E superfamily protein